MTAPRGAEQGAEGVGEVRRGREGADEHQVEVVGELRQEVLEAGVADEVHLVARLLAPDRERLRHDAREIRVHQTAVQAGPGGIFYDVENADAKRARRAGA